MVVVVVSMATGVTMVVITDPSSIVITLEQTSVEIGSSMLTVGHVIFTVDSGVFIFVNRTLDGRCHNLYR